MKLSTKIMRPLICLLMFFGITDLSATHIVGGDVTYEFVRFNSDSSIVTFLITFNMYRDTYSGGAQFNNNAGFGVFRQNFDQSWEHVETKVSDHGPITDIQYEDDPCRIEPTNVGVEATFYTFEVELEVGDQNYMIAYQRCCRNDNVINVFDSGDEGVAFNVIITPAAQRKGNNSPTFKEYPPIFICAGFPLFVDVSGLETDGDLLKYSFCTPFVAGGPDNSGGCDGAVIPDPDCPPPFDLIRFRPPFTADAQMQGDPVVTIDQFTGIMTGVPENPGQYIIGLCIEEYDLQGNLLSMINRDFQFNALECTKEITAALKADEQVIGTSNGQSKLVNVIKACGTSTVEFENLSFGATGTLYDYTWHAKDSMGNVVLDRYDTGLETFTAEFPDLGIYTGTLIVNDNYECPDTAFFAIERYADMIADFEYDTSYLKCYRGPIDFTDMSISEVDVVTWDWNFDDDRTDDVRNPSHEFASRGLKKVRLISEDSHGCVDTMIRYINYDPPHDALVASSETEVRCYGEAYDFYGDEILTSGTYYRSVQYPDTGCDSLEAFLDIQFSSPPRDTFIEAVLCPGEMLEYNGKIYDVAGEYTEYSRSIEFSAYGCDSLTHYISLQYDDPPTVAIPVDTVVVEAYTDYAIPVNIGGGAYDQLIWTVTEGINCDDCPNPIVNYDVDTTFQVEVLSSVDCRSAAEIYIDFIFLPDGYHIPNIVDYNSNNPENRRFHVQTHDWATDEVFYDMDIFDRWGNLQHTRRNISVNDVEEAWYPRGEEIGVYTYNIVIYEYWETHHIPGTVTFIK